MAKLTKSERKDHDEACALLAKDGLLTVEERWSILKKWQESAENVNSAHGAFFTPVGLARDFAVEVLGTRILDLCAGIGTLSFMAALYAGREDAVDITCVESNAQYLAVGKRILPQARWIQADVFDLPAGLGDDFDCVISNPPFGQTPRSGKGPTYTGAHFEYHVIDIAAGLGRYGVFIIPQQSAPFRLSGVQSFSEELSRKAKDFHKQTGLVLEPGCGVDTSLYRQDWHGVAPAVEIVCCDFEECRPRERALPVEPIDMNIPMPTEQRSLLDREVI